MKALLFLLIPIIMMGQDLTHSSDTTHSDRLMKHINNVVTMYDDSISMPFNDYIYLLLVTKFEEYEAECYADTFSFYKVFYLANRDMINNYAVITGCREQYFISTWTYFQEDIIEFKRKPTFKGFREFLRSKRF